MTGMPAFAFAENARVERLDVIPLAFPLVRPFRAAIREIASVDVMLVRIAAGGLTGHGYAFAFGAQDLQPIVACAHGLKELLHGQDPARVEQHHAAMLRALALVGAAGPALAALSAFDVALWDLTGQIANLPLARLLGGARESIPVYGSGGSLASSTEELVAEAMDFRRLGYPAFKLKLGHGIAADAVRVRAVREAVGPAMRLIVDGNQQWRPKEAVRAAQALEASDIWWLEEPVAAHDAAGCAAVRGAVSMQVATGETNFGVAEAARMLQANAADILMPNLQRVGGITGWRKVAAMAELLGVPMASHVYAEIGVHLMCAVPNGLTLEVLPWWPRLFVEPLCIEAGQAVPPLRAGLGLTLDHAVIAAHRVH